MSPVICAGAPPARAETGADDLRDYYSANGLLNRALHELAVVEYRKFLSEHGTHEKAPVAQYGLGVCLYELHRYDEATEVLAPLWSQRKLPYAAEVATMLGQCHLEQGRDEAAIEAFEYVLTHHADHALGDDAAAGAAESLYRLGRYDDVIAQCKKIASRWPPSSRLSKRAGRAKEAQRTFPALINGHPKHIRAAEAYAQRAVALSRQDRHAEAINAIERVERKYGGVLSTPLRAAVLYEKAWCLQKLNRADEAVAAYRKLLAAKLFSELIDSFPQSSLIASASCFCGEALLKIGRHGPAADHLTRVVEHFASDPLYEPSLLRLGEALAAIQRWPRSEQVFSEYLDRVEFARGQPVCGRTIWLLRISYLLIAPRSIPCV